MPERSPFQVSLGYYLPRLFDLLICGYAGGCADASLQQLYLERREF